MRRTAVILTTAIAFLATLALLAPSHATAQAPRARRVILVLAPYLTWEDVTPTSTPTLWGMAQDSALGNINARSRVREAGESASPLEGALTISAGSWAVPSFSASGAFNADERYEVGTAGEAFSRTTGEAVGSSRIVFLGLPKTQRVNQERSSELVLGTLGQSIENAGGATAAIGNSDVGYVTGEQRQVRPAALAAMDQKGLVSFGDISRRLLREDPAAPFGFETDIVAFEKQFDLALEGMEKQRGPELIVLDPGDGYRAEKFAPEVADTIVAQQRMRAVETLDGIVGLAEQRVGDDGVVVVASQLLRSNDPGVPEGLGPVIVHGSGWDGYLVSSSTQRTGIVTNLDVTATVMEILGIERPVQVMGNTMVPVASDDTLEGRIDRLTSMNRTAVAVDGAKPAVVNTFVAITVVVLLASAIVLVRSRYWRAQTVRRATIALKGALLLVLSVPASSWLMFALWRAPASQPAAIGLLLAALALVWGFALLVAWRLPMRVPVAAVSLLTTTVILVDQWLGAPFSFTNFFGYSPLLAARFYGLGNEAAAILFGSSIVGVALLFDQWPDSRWTALGKRFGVPLLGALVVATAAAPFFGANVGVAVWGLIGYAIAWLLMNGHHVSWKTAFWMFFAVAAVIGAFAAIDLFGGGAQTHLARALTSAEKGGLSELWVIVARKAATNARVLTHTNWAYILIAVLAFLGFMRWRPQGDFAETLVESPDFADAITVSLAAGVVAYFTEDSGIVIPALIVLYVGVGIVWLMLARSSLARAGEGR